LGQERRLNLSLRGGDWDSAWAVTLWDVSVRASASKLTRSSVAITGDHLNHGMGNENELKISAAVAQVIPSRRRIHYQSRRVSCTWAKIKIILLMPYTAMIADLEKSVGV
jgi:hypothetical protein